MPDPRNYRVILRETMNKLRQKAPSQEARDILIDIFLDGEDDTVETLFLSNAFFFGIPREAVGNDQFYPKALTNLSKFLSLFGAENVLLCYAIRNPATFLPNLFEASNVQDFSGILNGSNPGALRWSELALRFRRAFPELPILMWCNEDTPFLWPEILRLMTNVDTSVAMSGEYDLFKDIMPELAYKKFLEYIKAHPKIGVRQKRQVMVAFAEKFALSDVLIEELNAPNWTEELVARMTEFYDKDVELLKTLPKAQILLP